MENKDNVKVILLSDLWEIFVSKLWILMVVAIFAICYVATGTYLSYVPKYNSIATLYILQQEQSRPDQNYKDFDLALKIVNDCTYLIKGHSVLDGVIKELELKESYDMLRNSVTIINPTDTRIIEVSVVSDSPRKAKMIVDAICTVGTKKITEAMGYEQVYFYEEGILDYKPCNRVSILSFLLTGFLAAAGVYGLFVLAYILDDKIKTDEDIKNYLDLSILGDIPSYDDNSKKSYGSRYYGSKYYGGKYYRGGYYQSKAYGEGEKK